MMVNCMRGTRFTELRSSVASRASAPRGASFPSGNLFHLLPLPLRSRRPEPGRIADTLSLVSPRILNITHCPGWALACTPGRYATFSHPQVTKSAISAWFNLVMCPFHRTEPSAMIFRGVPIYVRGICPAARLFFVSDDAYNVFRLCGLLAPSLAVGFSTHVHQVSHTEIEPEFENSSRDPATPHFFDLFLRPPAGDLRGRQESCLSTIRLLSDSLQGAGRLDKLFRRSGGQYRPVES